MVAAGCIGKALCTGLVRARRKRAQLELISKNVVKGENKVACYGRRVNHRTNVGGGGTRAHMLPLYSKREISEEGMPVGSVCFNDLENAPSELNLANQGPSPLRWPFLRSKLISARVKEIAPKNPRQGKVNLISEGEAVTKF